jgi:hypothetical protein
MWRPIVDGAEVFREEAQKLKIKLGMSCKRPGVIAYAVGCS